MAYTIIKGQEKFICDTQEEVIYRFFTRTDYAAGGILRFADDELNVTGKDQRNINMDRFSRTYFTVFYHRNLVMRSIMVLDECGRPMDVRDWTEAIRRVESGYVPQKKTLDTPDPLYRRGPCGCGEKQREHFICGPAMWHRTYRDLGHADYLHELETVPGRTKGLRIRKPEAEHNVKKIVRRLSHTSKSWKEQGKSAAQWGKHKKGIDRASLRKFFERSIENESLDIPDEDFSEDYGVCFDVEEMRCLFS